MLPSPQFIERFAPLSPVRGCPSILAHQAQDIYELWQAWENEYGKQEEVPFWAAIWPASVMLACSILDNTIDVRGKKVLEIGCGGAVASIAAQKAGARDILANDIDLCAIQAAQMNARANNVNLKTSSDNYIAGTEIPTADVILLADMFYQKKMSAGLLEIIRTTQKYCKCKVIIADAQRAFAPRERVEEIRTAIVPVSFDIEGSLQREVRLFELISE